MPQYCLVASRGGLGATMLEVIKPSRWYEVLRAVHSQKNHAGRDKIFSAVKERYWNVPKFAIDRFSKLCQVSGAKKTSEKKTTSLLRSGTNAPGWTTKTRSSVRRKKGLPSEDKTRHHVHFRPCVLYVLCSYVVCCCRRDNRRTCKYYQDVIHIQLFYRPRLVNLHCRQTFSAGFKSLFSLQSMLRRNLLTRCGAFANHPNAVMAFETDEKIGRRCIGYVDFFSPSRFPSMVHQRCRSDLLWFFRTWMEQVVCCIKDVSSQFVQLCALRSVDGEEAGRHVLSFLFRFGGAHILHSENGEAFDSALMDYLAKRWDYPLVLGGYLQDDSTQSVELAEEFAEQWFNDPSRTEQEKLQWDTQLEKIAYSVNCTVNRKNGKSPHECVFGQKPKMGPVLPGITHSLVRDTYRRSFIREEELGK